MIKNKQLKKILFISPLPPPYYGSAISSEMCLSILNKVNFFKVSNIKINHSVELSDVGSFTINKITGFFYVLKQLIKEINKIPDIIYIVPATAGFALIRDSIFIKIINFNRKSKLIIHLRSQFLNKDFKNPFKIFLIKQILNGDVVILLGKELIENTHGYIAKHKIKLLPNAIPNSINEVNYKMIVDKRKLNDKINLLFLSNMMESKGWYKVLQACNLLKKNNKNINFVCHFIGAWDTVKDEKLFYKYIVNNHLNEHIIYHGRLIGEEKNNILTKTDILIFPTEYKLETFGRVIIEAMEFGIPVIANNIGSIPSVIEHGETGFILEENTPEKIHFFISKLLDDFTRLQMGDKARILFLNKFTLENYRNKFLEIFTLENGVI